MYDAFKDKAGFLTIYISEAHPEDEWQTDSNVTDDFVFKQPRSLDERRQMARILPDRLKYRIPVAVDPIEDPAGRAYAAWPERIYVVAPGGRVAYKAEPGPFGFKPEEARKSLERLLSGG
jgi:type I thyroxine 5'-deiodinase